MGKNDHVPVPDPKPQVRDTRDPAVQREIMQSWRDSNNIPKDQIGGPTTSTERLDALELNWEKTKVQAASFLGSLASLSSAISMNARMHDEITQEVYELRRLLKQTIRGVERLAQGHSKGNLGLPTDEDWTEFKP